MSYARIILLLVFHKDWFSNSLTLALQIFKFVNLYFLELEGIITTTQG